MLRRVQPNPINENRSGLNLYSDLPEPKKIKVQPVGKENSLLVRSWQNFGVDTYDADAKMDELVQMAVAASAAAMPVASTVDLLSQFKMQIHQQNHGHVRMGSVLTEISTFTSPPRTVDEEKTRKRSQSLRKLAITPERLLPLRTYDRTIRRAASKKSREARRRAAEQLESRAEKLHASHPPVLLGQKLPYASKLQKPISDAQYSKLPEFARLGALSREDFVEFVVSELAAYRSVPAQMTEPQLLGLVSKVQGDVGEFYEQLMFRAKPEQHTFYRHYTSEKTPGEPYVNFNVLTKDSTFSSVDSLEISGFRQVKTSCQGSHDDRVKGAISLIKEAQKKTEKMTDELLFREVEGMTLLEYLQETVNEMLPFQIRKEAFDLTAQSLEDARTKLNAIMDFIIKYAIPDDLVEAVSAYKDFGHLVIVGLGATSDEIKSLTEEVINERVHRDGIGDLKLPLYRQ